jgi:site-specific DNA recombinase
LELGSVRLLKQDLDQRGVASKVRLSRKGTSSGGKSFSRGALYELLSNPIYLGEIRHKQERNPGQHQAILERETWAQVQQRLCSGARRDCASTTEAPASPLAGKVVDEHGEPLYAQGASKNGKRYRYFVSRALVSGAANGRRGWRVPAPELEQAVLAGLRSILADQAGLVAGIEDSTEVEQILGMVANWRERLGDGDEARTALAELIQRVQLTGTGLRVIVNIPPISVGTGTGTAISRSHFVPMAMRRRGVELRLILDGQADQQRPVDPALLKALARARSWFEEVATGRVASLAAIGRREGLRKRYVTRLTKLAFVAPPIAEAIAAGRTPTGVNLQMLMDGRLELAHCWFEQQRMFSGVNSLSCSP